MRHDQTSAGTQLDRKYSTYNKSLVASQHQRIDRDCRHHCVCGHHRHVGCALQQPGRGVRLRPRPAAVPLGAARDAAPCAGAQPGAGPCAAVPVARPWRPAQRHGAGACNRSHQQRHDVPDATGLTTCQAPCGTVLVLLQVCKGVWQAWVIMWRRCSCHGLQCHQRCKSSAGQLQHLASMVRTR